MFEFALSRAGSVRCRRVTPVDVCPYGADHQLSGDTISASEQMLGLGGDYTYARCGTCGSLILLNPPNDPALFYPTDYYSFNDTPDPGVHPVLSRLMGGLLRMQTLSKRAGRGRFSGTVIPVAAGWFAGLGITRDSRILDVGAGGGFFLGRLRWLGFRNLAGIDPYLVQEERSIGPVVIRRKSLADVTEPVDVVIFHHVLEHIPDPLTELRLAARALAPGGHILVVLPLCDSDAFESYASDWFQLDAPRHLAVPTERGMRAMISEAGLELVEHWRTSAAIQFWASEQYKLGIPLASDRSWHKDPAGSPWTATQVKAWAKQAREINRAGRGDEGAFVIRRLAG